MAADDLAWLLARLSTREAQQDFVCLLRYAVAGIPRAAAEEKSPHDGAVETFSIPRWPFLITFQRNGQRIAILRLLPAYGGFAGPN